MKGTSLFLSEYLNSSGTRRCEMNEEQENSFFKGCVSECCDSLTCCQLLHQAPTHPLQVGYNLHNLWWIKWIIPLTISLFSMPSLSFVPATTPLPNVNGRANKLSERLQYCYHHTQLFRFTQSLPLVLAAAPSPPPPSTNGNNVGCPAAAQPEEDLQHNQQRLLSMCVVTCHIVTYLAGAASAAATAATKAALVSLHAGFIPAPLFPFYASCASPQRDLVPI